jgi:regulator of cell morphogenesis and NO signaling
MCAIFDALREATNDYTPHDRACADYRTFCRCLRDLELDQLQLIHLEDNVLFPRALKLESWSAGKAASSSRTTYHAHGGF